MLKLLGIIGIFLVLLTVVYNPTKTIIKDWDEPMFDDEEIQLKIDSHQEKKVFSDSEYKYNSSNYHIKNKKLVSHDEWSKIFDNWRSGKVSKEDTVKILKGVRRI